MKLTPMKILYYLFKMRYLCVKEILYVVIVLLIFSCSSLRNIEIEVAVQPEYPIDEDIQSLAVLNRSMTNQFTNFKIDSLEKILFNHKMLLDSIFQDSIAADTAIQVAANALFESARFDVVVPKERNIERTDTSEIVRPLNIDFINDICTNFKVDGVLVLENFAEQLKTRYSLGASEGPYYDGGINADTDVDYFSEWRLYRPHDLRPVIRFQVGDTIFWNASSLILEDAYSHMPRTKDALIGGGIEAGLKMSEYISPKWVNQTRYYYLTGKSEIDAAVPLIKENKWEEATATWSKYSGINSKLVRSKVEYNLALAAEMDGDLDLAIEWGLKSFKTRYSKPAEVYLKTLDLKRKAQQKENKKRY